MNDILLTLQDHRLNVHYCDIGVIDDDGLLLPEGYSLLTQWIDAARALGSVFIIPVLNYGNRIKNLVFGSDLFKRNIDATIADLLSTHDIDGIHLDIEGFVRGQDDELLLDLLKYLKGSSLNEKHLSISTPATVWTPDFMGKVADVVDMMNPMIYDAMGWGSSVVTAADYEAYFKAVIKSHSDAIGIRSCQLVPTLPVYEKKTASDGTVYHDPDVESLSVALDALNSAIFEGVTISGAGIFWGPHYLGLHPEIYDRFDQDQNAWKANWLKI
jgi:hypothetical protein